MIQQLASVGLWICSYIVKVYAYSDKNIYLKTALTARNEFLEMLDIAQGQKYYAKFVMRKAFIAFLEYNIRRFDNKLKTRANDPANNQLGNSQLNLQPLPQAVQNN